MCLQVSFTSTNNFEHFGSPFVGKVIDVNLDVLSFKANKSSEN